jgi:hypothetical protein
MDGNHVSVQAIDSGTEHEVMAKAANPRVPKAQEAIRAEPPQKVQEVRPGEFRDAVPGHARQIDVPDSLTVEVNFVFRRQLPDPFRYASLSAMPFVDEW